MSAKLMGQVWDLDIPHNEAWVLMALVDHADHDGNNIYPGLDLLAYKTNYSERQLRRVLDSLEDRNIIIPVNRGIGRGNVQCYRVDLKAAPLKPEKRTKRPVNSPAKSGHFDNEKADKMSSIEQIKADILTTEKRTFETEKADILAFPYKEEPSIEPSIEPSSEIAASQPAKKKQKKSSTEGKTNDPLFTSFVQAYFTAYGCPYQHKKGDFVQLAECRKKGGEWLTPERWERGVRNYFASALGNHTLADFSSRFGGFFRSVLDRFGKPVEEVVSQPAIARLPRPEIPKGATPGETKRIMEDYNRQLRELQRATTPIMQGVA